jgi:hypothetical protein
LFKSGSPDPRWDDDVLQELIEIPGSAFEAVDVSSLKTSIPIPGGRVSPEPADGRDDLSG